MLHFSRHSLQHHNQRPATFHCMIFRWLSSAGSPLSMLHDYFCWMSMYYMLIVNPWFDWNAHAVPQCTDENSQYLWPYYFVKPNKICDKVFHETLDRDSINRRNRSWGTKVFSQNPAKIQRGNTYEEGFLCTGLFSKEKLSICPWNVVDVTL